MPGLLLVALALGCAGHRTQSADDAFLPSGAEASATVKPLTLKSQLVYLVLAGELAGQRGQYDVALENYLQAARLSHDAHLAERATQIALFMKKSPEAINGVSLWLEREPRNATARRMAALLYLKEGRRDEAVAQLKVLLALPDADMENTLIELVRVLGSEVPKADAAEVMTALLRAFPRMAELHFAAALLAANQGEFQQALSQTEEALKLHPDWSRARVLQAQVMAQMGDSAAAGEMIRKALKREPDNARLRLIYSQFLVKSGDIEGARRELAHIVAKDPGNQDARFGLGLALMDLGQLDVARREFAGLANSEKWRVQAYFYLGLIEARKGKLNEAVGWFDRVTTGPIEFDARVNGITALISLGRLTEARTRLADVRKRFPNESVRLYLLEAELLTKNKDYEEAFALLTEALDDMPGQTDLLYARALVAENLGRFEAVEGDLRQVLEKNPDDPSALNALGYTLAERGERLDEAKGYLERAIRLKPDDPAILDSYGWLQYRLRNYTEAIDYLRRAYTQIQDPEIASHLGEVLLESGKRQEARKILRDAWKKAPEHEDMRRIKARYPDVLAP
ncbi:MAG: tetratricopeptide repeat protein [Methylococcus sp.]|nr:tetratricopeptide repeat protein [Methylococcus sp.]